MKTIKKVSAIVLMMLVSVSVFAAGNEKKRTNNLDEIKKVASKISYPQLKWDEQKETEVSVTVKAKEDGTLEVLKTEGEETYANYVSHELEKFRISNNIESGKTYRLKFKFEG